MAKKPMVDARAVALASKQAAAAQLALAQAEYNLAVAQWRATLQPDPSMLSREIAAAEQRVEAAKAAA